MSQTKSITINGREYDAHTGLALDVQPLRPSAPVPVRHDTARTAHTVHSTAPKRSQTLNRRTLKNPHAHTSTPASKSTTASPSAAVSIPVHTPKRHEIIHHTRPTRQAHQPSSPIAPAITRFAKHPAPAPSKTHPAADIAPAVVHPHVQKAHAISHIKAEKPLADVPAKRLTTQEIKRSAMQQAIHNTSVNQAHHATHHPLKKRARSRMVGVLSATLGLVMLGGYFTYLNMPTISTKVAAASAGIDANYPNYRPDGYSLRGLVGYQQNAVTMKFASNSGPQSFTLNQSKSNWDSSALLDNYIAPRTGSNYIPYTEQGLTIYTYGNNAAWVNGGILYTVEGDAPLSNEQLRHIATSLI